MPKRPEGLAPGKWIGDDWGGAMFVGTKGVLICGTYARDPFIVGRENDPPRVPQTLRRVLTPMSIAAETDASAITSHEMDWVRACKESRRNRVEPSAHFGYSGPLNEVVVMGNLAIRLQDLRRPLQWDGENMTITNIDENEQIRVVTTDTFEVVDGDPKFNTNYATINAAQAARNYIKRPYRNGWSY